MPNATPGDGAGYHEIDMADAIRSLARAYAGFEEVVAKVEGGVLSSESVTHGHTEDDMEDADMMDTDEFL